MGDGRYYTGLQFYSIFYFMCMIVITSILLATILIKNKGIKDMAYYIAALSCYEIILILKYLELVAYNLTLDFYLKQLIHLFIMLLPILFLQYRQKYIKNSLIKFAFLLQIVTLATMILLMEPKSHSYDFMTYPLFFYVLLGLYILCFGISSYLIYHHSDLDYFKKRVQLNTIGVTVMMVLWLFSDLFYQNKAYFLFIGLPILLLYKSITSYMPDAYLNSAYENIIHSIQDTVMVTDATGKILFQNHKHLGHLLHIQNKIIVPTLEGLFVNTPIPSNYISDFIVEDEMTYYLNIEIKPIMKSTSLKGYILRICDLSPLNLLMTQIQRDTIKLKSTHQQLQSHASVVYRLEENKIKSTMYKRIHEIFEKQGQGISVLGENILNKYNNQEDIHEDLYQLLELSREHLNTIRQSVSNFRRMT